MSDCLNMDLLPEFRKKFSTLPDDDLTKFHAYDVERIRNIDKYALSFVNWKKGDVDEAIKLAVDCLTWRNKNKVHDISVDSIGMNYVARGIIFTHGKDKQGHRILALLSCHCTKETKEQYKNSFIFWLERLQRAEPGKHITFILDSHKTAMSNIDLNFIRFVIDSFGIYFPDMLNKIVILDMPWILNAIWNIVKQWMTEEQRNKTMFCSRKELLKHVDSDQLPQILGGKDTWSWSYPPFPDDLPQISSFNNTLATEEDSQDKGEIEEVVDEEESITETKSTNGSLKMNLQRRHTTNAVVHREHVDRPLNSTMNKSYSSIISEHDKSFQMEEILLREILYMSPVSQLRFSVTSATTKNCRLQSSITLRNAHSSNWLMYKIKTTSPERFHVKPCVGAIEAGCTACIRVNLCAGYETTSTRDRFLILYKDIPVESAENIDDVAINEFWKNNNEKSVRFEQKLRVQVDEEMLKQVQNASPTGKKEEKLKKDKVKPLMKSCVSFATDFTNYAESPSTPPNHQQDVDALQHQITSLRHKISELEKDSQKSHKKFCWIFLILTFTMILLFYILYHIYSSPLNLAKTQHAFSELNNDTNYKYNINTEL